MTGGLTEGAARPVRTAARDEAPARPPRPSRGRLATWALGVAMIALSLSWFGAFALPVAILAGLLALATLILRRAQRELAWWALGLSFAAVACSAYWILLGMQQAAELAGRSF